MRNREVSNNVIAFPTTSGARTLRGPEQRVYTLAEIPGFMSALRDARAQRPDLPRDAFVKAGRIRRLEFNPSLQCDTLAVISWAEWAAKGGR